MRGKDFYGRRDGELTWLEGDGETEHNTVHTWNCERVEFTNKKVIFLAKMK